MYETGKREPDLETLEVFADFYNVDMNTLTGRTPTDRQNAEEKILPFVADALKIPQSALSFEDGVINVATEFRDKLDPNWVSLFSYMRYLVELNFPAFTQNDGQEFALLTTFHSLNKDGRRKLLEHATDLAEVPRYRMDNADLETSPSGE